MLLDPELRLGELITHQTPDIQGSLRSPNYLNVLLSATERKHLLEKSLREILSELSKLRVNICGTVHAVPGSPFSGKGSCPNQPQNLVCKHARDAHAQVHKTLLMGLIVTEICTWDDPQVFLTLQTLLEESDQELEEIDQSTHEQSAAAESTQALKQLIASNKSQERSLGQQRLQLRDELIRNISEHCGVEAMVKAS